MKRPSRKLLLVHQKLPQWSEELPWTPRHIVEANVIRRSGISNDLLVSVLHSRGSLEFFQERVAEDGLLARGHVGHLDGVVNVRYNGEALSSKKADHAFAGAVSISGSRMDFEPPVTNALTGIQCLDQFARNSNAFLSDSIRARPFREGKDAFVRVTR